VIIIVLFLSCCQKSTEPGNNSGNIKVSDINYSGCIQNEPKKSIMEECITCSIVNGNYLKMVRTNVCFNCCYDSLVITVDQYDHNRILITERENAALCQCNCLYNIEYIVGPFEYGNYELTIDLQYWQEDMKFDIAINDNTNQVYCEERTGYPWDI
jgi:hypothetical protein